jgi:hypothetical protein
MLSNDDPLEGGGTRALNPRHLTTEIREYEMTTYSQFHHCSELQTEISRPSCDQSDRQRLGLTTTALVDQLPEEVSDAPEPIDRVAGTAWAVAAAAARCAGTVRRAVLTANPHDVEWWCVGWWVVCVSGY